MLGTAVPAVAYEVDLVVDNPAYVEVQLDWGGVQLSEGVNHLSYASTISVSARDYTQHKLLSLMCDGVDLLNGSNSWSCYYDSNAQVDGKTLTLTSCLVDDLRTGSFTLTVDNPRRVSYITTDGNPGVSVPVNSLTGGEPYTVRFIPEVNTTLQLNSNGAPLYKIERNGELVSPDQWGTYNIAIEQDMDLRIYGDYPDIEASIVFEFANDAAALLGSVSVIDANWGYTPVEVEGNVARVPLGSNVQVKHAPSFRDYELAAYTYGDKTNYALCESYTFYVTTETFPIYIDATLSAEVPVTVNVANAEAVYCHRYNLAEVIDLAEGENAVTFHATNTDISFRPLPGGRIAQASLNGSPLQPDWSGNYRVQWFEAGDVFEVTGELVDPYTASISVGDPSLVRVTRNPDNRDFARVVELQPGLNTLTCSEGNNLFRVERTDKGVVSGVSVDGVEVAPNMQKCFEFRLDSGSEAVIGAEEIVNEGDYVLWVDNMEAPNVVSFNLSYFDGQENDTYIVTGYNLKPFFHAFNDYEVSAYYLHGEPVTMSVYLNNKSVAPRQTGSTRYPLSLKPADVLRVYLENPKPAKHEVEFTVDNPDGAALGFCNVVRDLITVVDDWEYPAYILEGSVYEFSVDAPDADGRDGVVVTANGYKMQPDSEGVYTLTVTGPVVITLAYGDTAAVSAVDTDRFAAAYYTIDGHRLPCEPSTPGLYIRVRNGNSSKILVK